MVQFAEPLPEPELNLNTIADIGKERIRRVIAQMQAEREGQLPLDTRDSPEDLGFRVFKLAPSTFRQWELPDDAGALAQQLTFFDRGLEEGADPRDVLYEVILKEGYPLTSHIETLPLDTNRIYRVTDTRQEEDPPSFYLCLDAEVRAGTLDALPLDKETILICLDSALDDSQKVNLAKQCLLKVL
jgi:adenine-specific DNA-methyltransferase